MVKPSLSVHVCEVPGAAGWVVVASEPDKAWAAAELEWNLHRNGLSTASVSLATGTPTAITAAQLREVGAWVQRETAGGSSVRFSGVGAGAAAALQAAGGSPATGALIWRGDLHRATLVPGAAMPTMIVVHPDEGRAAHRAGRAAVRQLGAQSRLAVMWSTEDPVAAVGGWAMAAEAGCWPQLASQTRLTSQRPLHRRLTIPTALALGASSLLLPASVAAAAPAHSSAGSVAKVQRLGDSVASTPAVEIATKTGKFAGKRIPRQQRDGDGVHAASTGSKALVDQGHMKWFVNTDITFATTSSASGAMSEASFTAPVAASTLNGATTPEQLNDAYDGYQTLCISVNGTTGQCGTGTPAKWTVYDQLGTAPSLACNGRQLDFPTQAIGALSVSREVYVPSDDHFARWLDTVTNTGPTAKTLTLSIANNLGSDNNTVITGSSSGDTTATVADGWVTSFQNFSGTTSSDPREGHVLEGPGAKAPLAGVFFANGNDKPWWDYTLTVQPGQTANILNFGVADGTIAESKADSARLDALPATAVECLTQTQLTNIVNFNANPAQPQSGGATTSTPDAKGYWVASPAGTVSAFGDAKLFGSLSGVPGCSGCGHRRNPRWEGVLAGGLGWRGVRLRRRDLPRVARQYPLGEAGGWHDQDA